MKKILPRKLRHFLRKMQAAGIIPYIPVLPTPLIDTLIKKYCTGKGLEIGPGKHPCCDPKNTLFLDKHTDNQDGAPNADIVSDASQLPVYDCYFDFLFSSHCLEHCPNTLKTLYEWKRVIKPGSIMFLVLPHGDRIFDKHRAKTDLEHHIRDFQTLTDKHDYSHVDEIKEGWSKNEDFEELKKQFERDWGFQMWDFESRVEHDVIHYHVWTQNEVIDVLKYIGLKILYVVDILPERDDSFLVIAKK